MHVNGRVRLGGCAVLVVRTLGEKALENRKIPLRESLQPIPSLFDVFRHVVNRNGGGDVKDRVSRNRPAQNRPSVLMPEPQERIPECEWPALYAHGWLSRLPVLRRNGVRGVEGKRRQSFRRVSRALSFGSRPRHGLFFLCPRKGGCDATGAPQKTHHLAGVLSGLPGRKCARRPLRLAPVSIGCDIGSFRRQAPFIAPPGRVEEAGHRSSTRAAPI
jgi:hypothetical protein